MSRVPPSYPDVLLLSCGIGRGHPFYLDGIQQALRSEYPDIVVEYRTVFELANPPALIGWNLAKLLYHFGSQGGMKTEIYEKIRKGDRRSEPAEYLKNGLASKVARYRDAGTIVIVDHPLLAVNLAELEVWYQHGELVAPESSLVDPGGKILVPNRETAEQFETVVNDRSRIVETNSCIESEIETIAEHAAGDRIERLRHAGQLCAAFFSSGAEPQPHLDLIIVALQSLIKAGHRSILFVAENGKLHSRLKKSPITRNERVDWVVYRDRHELHRETVKRWNDFDLFLSPYHERIHWAAAASLPMIGYTPTMGPFAPMNRTYAANYHLAYDLTPESASQVGSMISDSGWRTTCCELSDFSRRGHVFGGFQNIANLISQERRVR